MLYDSMTQLIGNTPMLDIRRIHDALHLKARVLVKLESFNPGGSVKDRVALAMVEDAEQRGLLHPGALIVEPTSGNTGIGLAWVAKVKGYRLILTMPETMSRERMSLLRAYGAELVLTPGAEGMKGAIEAANRILAENPGAFMPGQFDNPANPAAHARTTAHEIWADTDGCIDCLVAGVGTGGTLCGTASALKQANPGIKVVAVEPADSPVLSGGHAGAHKLQGIGAGFVPGNYNPAVVDEVVTVTTDEAYEGAHLLAGYEGLLCGISSGAALYAALQLAQRPELQGRTIVTILPDTGERYLSTDLFKTF